jgi:hypothetical protein
MKKKKSVLLKSGRYKKTSISYPKYEQIYDDDLYYEKYAERLERIRKEGMEVKYPFKINSRKLSDGYPNFELKNTIFLYVTPERFLELAFPKAHINITSIDYLFDAFEFGDPELDPLFLYVDPKLRVIQHEGRHRAEISRDLDIELLPIVIKFTYIYTDLTYKDIIDYEGKVEENGFDFKDFMNIQDKVVSLKTKNGRIIGKEILIKLLKPEKNPNLDRGELIRENRGKRRKYGIAKLFSLIRRIRHSKLKSDEG